MSTPVVKYYLAGPMSGIPQFNIPTFDNAATDLRERGHDVTSPAELDSAEMRESAMQCLEGDMSALSKELGETWGDCLARDVKMLADELDAVIALPGWRNSKGANLELYVAMLCNKPIYEYAPYIEQGFKKLNYKVAAKAVARKVTI